MDDGRGRFFYMRGASHGHWYLESPLVTFKNARKERPGEKFSPDDKRDYAEMTRDTVRERTAEADDTEQARRKRQKRAEDAPRKAAWHWGMAIQNSYEVAEGAGLERWIPPLRPWDEDMQLGEDDPGCCIGLCDEEGTQWCTGYYLQNSLHGQFLFFQGPVHRRDNDSERSLATSGNYLTLEYLPRQWHLLCLCATHGACCISPN